jgi:hypothetical protein
MDLFSLTPHPFFFDYHDPDLDLDLDPDLDHRCLSHLYRIASAAAMFPWDSSQSA